MNLVVDDCIKRSCLVTSLAPKAFEELRRVCLPKSPFDFTFSDIESQMSKLFGSRVVLLKERSKLFGLQQEAHQTPMQFANYLRHMAANCDFDQFNTDAALVVQFVNGIRNQAVRVKLLAKGKDLTLDDAVTYLQISEDIQREDANTVNEAMDSKTCHAVNTYPSKNHVIQPKHGNLRLNRRWRAMKQINRADAVMLQVLSRVTPTPFRVDVTIDGRPVVMELDTGASVTLVNSTLWKRIGYPELSPPTVQLRSFTGHVISLKGEATVSVGCRGQLKQLRIRMANQPVVNIMGRDWIEAFGDADSLRMIFTRDASINCIGSGFQGKKIFDQFEALFKPELGHCTKIKAHLELKEGAVPVFRRPFPLAFAMHDAVEKELDRYVKMGILTPLDRSSWAAPVVTVKKPNSRIRICADFSTGLNDQLVIDSYPIPRPEDLCQALRGGITFTKLDLSDAYLQVELDDEYKKFLLSTRTKDYSSTTGYHLVATLREVLRQLEEFGFRIRKEECTFFQKEVEYLGHILSARGIQADPKRTAAIVNMPLPGNVAKLRSFLADASNEGIGAVIYHRLNDGTVNVVAHASKTLNRAQRNYAQIEKEALAIVYGVKKFHKYLWGRHFTLLTDHKPLLTIFRSKKGVPQTAACRLTRWAVLLMNYSFDIEYRSTRDFGQADCLSRLPSSSDELFDAKFDQHDAEEDLTVKRLIVEMQAELPVTAKLIAEMTATDKWPDRCPSKNLHDYFVRCTELSVSYGCLVWGIRTVIPTKLRSKILAKLHQTHPGRERMVLMARQFCWWPGMSKDIEMKVRSCEGCITAQKNPPKVAVRPWEVADGPWKRIHVDFANVNGEMFMVVVDAHSKWPEVVHMQRITAQQTIETLKTIFARIGDKVRVRDYVQERNPWREGIIVGQRGQVRQVTWFVRVREITWKRHTNQLRRIGAELGNDEAAAQDVEMASLPDEETVICSEHKPASSITGQREVKETPYSRSGIGVTTQN
ncbi:hypothetical protein M513_10811, partial [Trichuris suis]